MKKIINKLFAGSLLAGMMLVSSCAGDYLDTAPTDSTGATDAVGTTANAMKALNGYRQNHDNTTLLFWRWICW